MTIRPNRYYGALGTTSGYNSPEIGQAASSLGKMFSGIPEAADVRSAAEAKATTERASRLAQLFTDAGTQGVDQARLDRQAAIAGAYNPNQSLTAVGMNNAVDLQKNTADNTRALQQTGITQRGENLRAATAPLSEGQTRAPGLGRFFGAPDMPENTQGVVKLNEGQVATGPNGFTAAGTPKPATETELKAKILGGLPANDQRATVMSSVGVETALGPDGKPVFVNRSDAAGLSPQGPDMSARVKNYGTPDGTRGTAVPDRDGRLRDTQTGKDLPVGAQVFDAQAAGTPDQLGGKTTEAENKNAYAARMTAEPTKTILEAFDTGKLPTGTDGFLRGVAGMAPAALGPTITNQMSPDGQIFFQGVKSALPMQLLTQSGQGVTEAEYERKMAELVPFAGEDPRVTAAKRAQFATYQAAVQGLAGGAMSKVNAIPAVAPGAAAPVPTAPGAPSPGQTVMPSLATPVPPAQQNQTNPAGAAIAMPPGMPSPAGAAPTFQTPTPESIAYLKANPGTSPMYDQMYGPGASAGVLGTR